MRTGIQVKGISKKIGDQQILEDVDITCLCKSITGIIGRNGSGCKFCSNGTPILKSAVHSF